MPFNSEELNGKIAIWKRTLRTPPLKAPPAMIKHMQSLQGGHSCSGQITARLATGERASTPKHLKSQHSPLGHAEQHSHW